MGCSVLTIPIRVLLCYNMQIGLFNKVVSVLKDFMENSSIVVKLLL